MNREAMQTNEVNSIARRSIIGTQFPLILAKSSITVSVVGAKM